MQPQNQQCIHPVCVASHRIGSVVQISQYNIQSYRDTWNVLLYGWFFKVLKFHDFADLIYL